MATTNFLSVKTHLSDFKSNADKDAMSEVSESGTSNSVASAEDVQKLAVILGISNIEDVYQEKFRVDRRRLEGMLAENLEESQTAQAFFHRIMSETNTLINWPARLKIGARSKKDPHVRIAGRADDVKRAREKIMQVLDTRSNRVTMKIDVSYTDHSHIIGKGGLTIKRVMEDTGCHIHFPDSNRTSATEKSNQVSIAGDMERVERARARVRALTPLVFSFELPIAGAAQPLPDLSSPYVQQLQDQYNVQVMVRNRSKLHANMMVVKGVQWEVQATMEATGLLMNYMCGPLASQTQVHMSLEISPAHHGAVVGRGAEQLKLIMRGTGTQIMFPDAADPNIPALRKSCVTITGHMKDVYAARQQLVGSLPLVVIFDMPAEGGARLDEEAVGQLMQKHNVFISVRHKPKQGIASVIIKGIERCANDIYEARRELLGGKEPVITAEIPESYNIPVPTGAIPNFGVYNPFSVGASPCSPYGLQLELGLASPMGALGGALSPVSPPALPPWLVSPQHRAPLHLQPLPQHNNTPLVYKNSPNSWNSMCAGADMAGMQQQMLQPYHQMPDARPITLNQLLNCSSQASSGYQSNFTGSSVSLDVNNTSGGETSNVASPSVSPISAHSPAPSAASVPSASADNERNHNELASLISGMPLSARRAVGCEKKTLQTLARLSPLMDYQAKRAEAEKAMRESVGGGYRVPTAHWAGNYFSKTSPGVLTNNANGENNTTPEKGWNRSELVRPNIVEMVTPPKSAQCAATPAPLAPLAHQEPSPQPAPAKLCRYQQLYELLRDIGLYKYVDLFKKHELDMSTFASLNEADLVEIGVTAFGARRKMLLTIAELQKQAAAFKSGATPGGAGSGERQLVHSPQYDLQPLQDNW
ncbi:Protein bicaudal C [Papilio xuthus]|uniref:Protein bicaudal C n=1 Tax=Papilio xuthus TaxID=66420 RepID=A0A0N1I581_PAPXU|nr:Protein bicaudal C [Papilio xuthus]